MIMASLTVLVRTPNGTIIQRIIVEANTPEEALEKADRQVLCPRDSEYELLVWK
jgi:hypothetical protein